MLFQVFEVKLQIIFQFNMLQNLGRDNGDGQRPLSDHCPAPFSYSVWQKGYFHPYPLTLGVLSPLISLLSCSFTLFHQINQLDICVLLTG